jgi:hypothetical protein
LGGFTGLGGDGAAAWPCTSSPVFPIDARVRLLFAKAVVGWSSMVCGGYCT